MGSGTWDKYWGDGCDHGYWERPAPEVIEFIASQLPESRPAVLDLGCGLGRHAIAFARRGFRVAATDASQGAIDHTKGWAGKLGLAVETHACSMIEQPFPRCSFDIVLSYNVLYHGRRHQFADAIGCVWDVLKPSGLFFFTCPTRRDGKHGHGERIAPHTYAAAKSVTPGDTHYFADRTDLDEMLARFAIRSIRADEGFWDNKGEKQFFSNWHVLAEKTEEEPRP